MRSLPIIIPGVILVIFGIIFNFQGQGMVGPETSFMYQNQDWIDNGIIISMLGVILILIGNFLFGWILIHPAELYIQVQIVKRTTITMEFQNLMLLILLR